MNKNRAGMSGGNYFRPLQFSPAGYPASYGTVEMSWSDREGLTPQGMSRLVIIALLLIGPYISLLFPVQGAAITTASDQQQSSNPAPAPAPENKVAPAVTGLNSTPQAPAASGQTCYYTGGSPLKGLRGKVYAFGSGVLAIPVTVTVRDGNSPYNVVSSHYFNEGGGGDYAFVQDSQGIQTSGVPSDEVLIIQFDATQGGGQQYATTYFDYFGAGSTSGRYNMNNATRVWFANADCTAYALVPNPLPANYPISSLIPITLPNLPSNYLAITMTTAFGSPLGGSGTFDVGMPLGRGIGGRVFSDDGSNNPPPYYNDQTDSQVAVSVKVYTVTNGIVGSNPVGINTVDSEGFYTLGGNVGTALLNGTYILKFEGNNIATSYYCNYRPGSHPFSLASAVTFNLSSGQPNGSYVVTQSPPDSRVTTNNPPCSTASGNLSIPGLHDVLRPNVQISGTITLAGTVPQTPYATTIDGAYAVAYKVSDGSVAGTSDPVTTQDTSYLIEGLQPNTQYYVRFFAPPIINVSQPPQVIGEYYNNKSLDTPAGSRTIVTTPAQGTVQNINAVLDQGWGFQGNAFVGVAQKDVEVSVYRVADLGQPNPQPIDQLVVNQISGNYATHQILEPGQSYVINFRPFGAASGYIAAWCGPQNGSNCTNVADSASAAQFTPVGFPSANPSSHVFNANINLNLGVILQGNISAVDNAGNPLPGGFPAGTNAAVYVYTVDNQGANPSLAQLFNVALTGASTPYTTSALLTNTNYVLRFVPTSPVSDPGFRAAYYSQTQLIGSVPLSGASIVNKTNPSPPNYTGFNIGLVRAAGITVTLLDYQSAPYPNVRVEVFGADQYPPGPTTQPYYSGSTDNNGVAVIPGIGTAAPSGNAFHIRFSPTSVRGSIWYTTTLSTPAAAPVNLTPGVFTPINFTMPPVASAGGSILNNGNNWGGSLIEVYNSDFSFYGTFQSDPQGTVYITNTAGTWKWDALLPQGTYYFAVISPTTGTYVRHWFVGADPNGADPNKALPVSISPSAPNLGVNVTLNPGGVARVYVTDPFAQPIPNATVSFYPDSTSCSNGSASYSSNTASGSGPANALLGSTFSRPSNTALWYKVTAPSGSLVEDGSCADFNTAPFQNPPFTIGQTKYLSVTLPPTPIISGTVKKRGLLPNLNQEFPMQGVEVALVDNADQVLASGTALTTTDSLGRYSMRLPQGFFKLRFRDLSGSGLGTRYWVNNPQQTGTLTNTLATTLQKIAGQNYINYNQIYDLSVPNNNSCRITDMFVLNTTVNSAQIEYFTNCSGNSQLGWNQGSPTPGANSIASYSFSNAVTDPGGVYTHTATMTGLAADTNYYVRAFSQMPVSGGPVVASDVELQVRTSSNGKSWYFASGNITTTATVSTTEVLHLFNYNNVQANATITYVVLGQTPIVKNVSIPANSRKDVKVNDPNDTNSLASAGVPYRTNHSTMVTADQSIMVEKSQTATGLLNGYPYNGGYTVPGATAPSINWWFPEISTVVTKEQVLSIYNPSTTISACLKLTYMDGSVTGKVKPDGQGGNPIYLIILPNSRKDINVATDTVYGPGAGAAEYGVLLSSFTGVGYCGGKVGVIAELETHYVQPTFDFYHKGVAGIMGASGSSQRWYFLDGQSDKAYDVQYSILNTVNSPGVVTITASIDNPATGNIALTYQITRTLAANQRISYSLPYTLFNQSASGQRFGFTARVDASVAVVAQRSVRYLYSSTPAMDSLYQELGTTRASGRWLFAAGDTTLDPVTPNYTEESLNIYNSAPYSTSLTITYYFDTGAPVTFTNYVLGPYSRINLQPYATANLPGPNYPSVGTGKVIAVMIDSANSGVFAERLVYWRKGNINGGGAIYGWNPSGY